MGILNLNGQDSTVSDNQEVEQSRHQLQVTEDSTDPTQMAHGHVPNANDGVEKDKAVVIMDGPLGHIYTQALNLAFAKEDTGAMFSVLMKKLGEHGRVDTTKNPEPVMVDVRGTYVYAIDDKELDNVGLVSSLECIREAINSGKYKQVVLAMEGSTVTSKMQLLDQASREIGAKVCLSRNRTVETVIHGK